MLGFDPLTAGTLFILAASPGGDLCGIIKPTEINVIPRTQDVKYDTAQTLEQLQAQSIDTIDPYGFHGVSRTQAYMSGQIKMTPRVKIDYKQLPETGAVCLWYDTVEIEIEIDPTIVVAKEVYADKCKKKAVIAHEMKHIMVDRKIVNQYAQIMGQEIFNGLKARGFKVGPVLSQDAQPIADRMQRTVGQILEHEYKKMELDRIEQQRAIDNLEEYESVSAQCP